MSTTTNSQLILCCYINQTQRIQIAKLLSSTAEDRVKVVFPGERFLFEATTDNKLEVYISLADRIALLDSISCPALKTQTSTARPFELARS